MQSNVNEGTRRHPFFGRYGESPYFPLSKTAPSSDDSLSFAKHDGELTSVPSTSKGLSGSSADDLISVTLPTRSNNANKRKHIRANFDYANIPSTALEAQKRERERLERLEKLRDNTKVSFDGASAEDSTDSREDSHLGARSPSPLRHKPKIEVIELSSDEDEVKSTVKASIKEQPDSRFPDEREDETDRLHRLERERLLKKNDLLKKIGAGDLIDGHFPINTGKPAEDPDVYVAAHLADVLQPHQLDGIRFMYDNIIETLHGFSDSSGFGCILAHSMGLGKTIQVISFAEVFLRTTPSKKVLIIVPVNTIQNWYSEFDKWLPNKQADDGTPIRQFPVYLLGDSIKNSEQRFNLIKEWHSGGGVLLMGYDMFRLLVQKKLKKTKPSKKPPSEEVVDLEKEEMDSNALADLRAALVDPGPDLVVCDEGHRIKNEKTGITVALSAIRTRRRVILTGYPLQNNLSEYFCMVDFVRPSYLGTKKEFGAMFEKPIKNGLCLDSTGEDVKLARQRTHVLIELLKGFVHRRTHSLLKDVLPPMTEYVILLRKSPIQRALYRAFVQYAHKEIGRSSATGTFNPLKAFAACSKIYNHPDILLEVLRKTKGEKSQTAVAERGNWNEENVLQTNEVSTSNGGGSLPAHESSFASISSLCSSLLQQSDSNSSDNSQHVRYHDSSLPFSSTLSVPESSIHSRALPLSNEFDDLGVLDAVGGRKGSASRHHTTIAKAIRDEIGIDTGVNYEWADVVMHAYEPGVMSNGYKMSVSFAIIAMAASQGEKILLFSQSLLTLNLMERYLQLPLAEGGFSWKKNVNYFRFDGSTSGSERERLINRFNNDPNVALFLISTRAGSLGINLVSANRVIIFDASWNPCHDAQAVCRVYRYGQTKPTFVYRLIVDNSMEKGIFNRQIGKNGLQLRVVDEKHMDIDVTKRELEQLLVYNEAWDVATENWDITLWGVKDELLLRVAAATSHMFSQMPVLHESLLMEREDGLSAAEKDEALLLYRIEKLNHKWDVEDIWRSHHSNRNWSKAAVLSRFARFQSPMRNTPVAMGLMMKDNESAWPSHLPRPLPLHGIPPAYDPDIIESSWMNHHPRPLPVHGVPQPDDPDVADSSWPNHHPRPFPVFAFSFRIRVSEEFYLRSMRDGAMHKISPQTMQIVFEASGKVYLRSLVDGHVYDASDTRYANYELAMRLREVEPRAASTSDDVICLSDSD